VKNIADEAKKAMGKNGKSFYILRLGGVIARDERFPFKRGGRREDVRLWLESGKRNERENKTKVLTGKDVVF